MARLTLGKINVAALEDYQPGVSPNAPTPQSISFLAATSSNTDVFPPRARGTPKKSLSRQPAPRKGFGYTRGGFGSRIPQTGSVSVIHTEADTTGDPMPIDSAEQVDADERLIEALRTWHSVMHGERVSARDVAVSGLTENLADLFEAQDIVSQAWESCLEARAEFGEDSDEYDTCLATWLEAAKAWLAASKVALADDSEDAEPTPVQAAPVQAPAQVTAAGYSHASYAPPGYAVGYINTATGQMVVTQPAPAPQPQSVAPVPAASPASGQPVVVFAPGQVPAPAPEPRQQVVYVQAPQAKPKPRRPSVILAPQAPKKKKKRLVLMRRPTK
jgi:hypothetical protein